MTSTLGLSHPAIKSLLDKRLEKLPPEMRELVSQAAAKQEESARAQAATPATLAELSARITRSDARAATAIEQASALSGDVAKLRALVLEMTARVEENTRLLNSIMTELGIKR